MNSPEKLFQDHSLFGPGSVWNTQNYELYLTLEYISQVQFPIQLTKSFCSCATTARGYG